MQLDGEDEVPMRTNSPAPGARRWPSRRTVNGPLQRVIRSRMSSYPQPARLHPDTCPEHQLDAEGPRSPAAGLSVGSPTHSHTYPGAAPSFMLAGGSKALAIVAL